MESSSSRLHIVGIDSKSIIVGMDQSEKNSVINSRTQTHDKMPSGCLVSDVQNTAGYPADPQGQVPPEGAQQMESCFPSSMGCNDGPTRQIYSLKYI